MLLLNFILSVLLILPVIAFFTVIERKVIASVQRRRGPNVVGIWGSLQIVADGLKLIVKEIVIPTKINRDLFLIAPIILLALSFLHWAIIPLGVYDVVVDSPLSVLFVLAISSLSVYGIICRGWASNSKYAFIGSLRSIAQMISYEISLSLIILPIILVVNSFNLIEIVFFQHVAGWLVVPLMPLFVIFFISMLIETNRTPFDLPEIEIELVIGYNVVVFKYYFCFIFFRRVWKYVSISFYGDFIFFGRLNRTLINIFAVGNMIYCESFIFLFFIYFCACKFTSIPLWSVNVNRLKSVVADDFRLFSVGDWDFVWIYFNNNSDLLSCSLCGCCCYVL